MFIFQELKGVLCSVPEIVELVGGGNAKQFLCVNEWDGSEKGKELLESIFGELMSASNDATREMVSKMKRRLNREKKVYHSVYFFLPGLKNFS